MSRTGNQRKHPRKAQARLGARTAAFERDHAPENAKVEKPLYTRPGSRKR